MSWVFSLPSNQPHFVGNFVEIPAFLSPVDKVRDKVSDKGVCPRNVPEENFVASSETLSETLSIVQLPRKRARKCATKEECEADDAKHKPCVTQPGPG